MTSLELIGRDGEHLVVETKDGQLWIFAGSKPVKLDKFNAGILFRWIDHFLKEKNTNG